MRPVSPFEVPTAEFGMIHDQLRYGQPVDADLADELSEMTGTSPDFWLNLQDAYDRDF